MTEPERVHIYVVSEILCPLCAEPFPVRPEAGAVERLEKLGISEQEQFHERAGVVAEGTTSGMRMHRGRHTARRNCSGRNTTYA